MGVRVAARTSAPAKNWERGTYTTENNRLKAYLTSVMEDQNPGLDGAGEGAEDLELTIEEEQTVPPKESSGDPLDDIQDPVARAEAKKWRAIARRTESPEEKPVVTASTPEFLTKADFFKSNEKNAIREATADPEVKANWSDIVPFYTPRRGKETKEDILEDIKDAIILYKARNPDAPVKDDSVDQLTATPVVKSGGGVADKVAPKPNNPPNFKLPTPPSQWYEGKKS